MQRMISHAAPLPTCSAGHTARHMHDLRARHASGGHLVECMCRHTRKFDTFEEAMRDWHTINDLAPPAPRPATNVFALRGVH